MREKLIDLIHDAINSVSWDGNDYPDVESAADILIANGVTFATDNNVGSKWIPVTERLPENFVSVLGYMTDAGDFPPVRECYTVGNAFFFPALRDVHPVSHWMPLPELPKEVE